MSAGKLELPHPREAAESLLVLCDATRKQLCARTDHARRQRIPQTFRCLLKRILREERIPEFEA
jgi:hypothetical protein